MSGGVGGGGGRGRAVVGLVKNYSEQHRSRRLHTQRRDDSSGGADRGERRRLRVCRNTVVVSAKNK